MRANHMAWQLTVSTYRFCHRVFDVSRLVTFTYAWKMCEYVLVLPAILLLSAVMSWSPVGFLLSVLAWLYFVVMFSGVFFYARLPACVSIWLTISLWLARFTFSPNTNLTHTHTHTCLYALMCGKNVNQCMYRKSTSGNSLILKSISHFSFIASERQFL